MMETPAFKEPANLGTSVADHLAAMIQTGALPPGERLVQTDLAARFGVSRVTIRDALKVLERRGLAVETPRKGMAVRQVSEKTVRDLAALQRVIDVLAVQEACRRVTSADLQALEATLREQEEAARAGNQQAVVDKDWEFHYAIYRIADNEPLQDVVSHLWPRTRQARGLGRLGITTLADEWGHRSVARHKRVLELLRAGDAERVAEVVGDIMKEVEEELLRGVLESDR